MGAHSDAVCGVASAIRTNEMNDFVEVFVIMVLDGILFSSATKIFFSLPFLLFNFSQVSTSTNFIKVAAKKAEWNACLAK